MNNKKIPCIPPLFHGNSFITYFKRKAELSNSFFAKQCFLVIKNSEISPTIFLKTNKYLSNVTFTKHGIQKILLNLNPNWAFHGHDSMSIRILQICDKCISKPYEIIYKSCFEKACFRYEWKKSKCYTRPPQRWQKTVKNYHPILVWSIFGKILKRLLHNSMFDFFYGKYSNLTKSMRWFMY